MIVACFLEDSTSWRWILLSKSEDLKRTAPRITVPEPEMTNENKFKCPLDQQIYDNREDYEAHCKEEHDVL